METNNEFKIYDFGDRLANLRKKHGYSQEEFASRMHLHRNSIGGYENNTITPSVEVLVSLALAFNVSTDYLLGLDKNATINLNGFTDEQKEVIIAFISSLKQVL